MDLYKQIIIDLKKELVSKNREIDKLNHQLSKLKKKCFCGLNFRNDNPKTYSKRQVDRMKQNIETVLTDFDDKISEGGFRLHKVEIIDVKLSDKRFKNPFTLFFTTDEQNNCDPLEVLYFKDRWNIADHVYQSLTNTFNLRLPTLYSLKKLRKDLNEMFDLNETIPQSVFVATKKRIEEQLFWFLEHLEDLDSISSLKVKLSADGTNVGRNFKIVNFTFTILNEGDRAKTASGNYTLGLSKLNEDYNGLEEPLKYLSEQIKDFTQLEFKNRKFDVKFFLCSDWKLTAAALGLYAATSDYPCLWCTAKVNELHDLNKKFSITDPDLNARTHEQQKSIIGKKTKVHMGYKKERIFGKIDFINDFPNIVKIDSIQKLWVDFYEIYYLLKDNAIMPYLMKKKTSDWLELFLKIYLSTHVTPYIHAFTSHLFQFQRLYGDINLFNLQCLEKLNDQTTNEYFKSSNKGPKTMVQLILRRLRIDHFMNHSNQPIN